MNPIGYIKCLFVGHDIDPEESIVSDIMLDKRNWLCKCHRCGLYEMRDGAISGITATISKHQAMRIRIELKAEMEEIHRVYGKRT